jgi:hypothetical protein
MPAEPAIRRAVAFIDGRNLFHSARAAFGHTHPNYVACAFPSSSTIRSRRGIHKTDSIRIDRATYDLCLDSRDYR